MTTVNLRDDLDGRDQSVVFGPAHVCRGSSLVVFAPHFVQALYTALSTGECFMGAPTPLLALTAALGRSDGRPCRAGDGTGAGAGTGGSDGSGDVVVGSVVAQQMDAHMCCATLPAYTVLEACCPGDQVLYLLVVGVAEEFRYATMVQEGYAVPLGAHAASLLRDRVCLYVCV